MREKNSRLLNGYLVIYRPEHPKAMKSNNWDGYVYEHIVVAEKDLGRSITDDEEVHHLDLNRFNNSPENLLVLSSKSHRKLHIWLRLNKIKPIKKKVVRCKMCNSPLRMSEQKMYCSDICYHKGIKSPMELISVEQIQEDFIQLKSMVKVAKKYNLSDSGLKKWMKKKFNISNEDLCKLKFGIIKLDKLIK